MTDDKEFSKYLYLLDDDRWLDLIKKFKKDI